MWEVIASVCVLIGPHTSAKSANSGRTVKIPLLNTYARARGRVSTVNLVPHPLFWCIFGEDMKKEQNVLNYKSLRAGEFCVISFLSFFVFSFCSAFFVFQKRVF